MYSFEGEERILSGLNQQQKDAVTSPLSSALVVAGAGSGKTRVLVHRVAWLCGKYALNPRSIMVVTFTNKAAAELKQRVSDFVTDCSGIWLGTFHGLCHKLLRIHSHHARLPDNFQIIDSRDQNLVLKRVSASMDISDRDVPLKTIQFFINHSKEQGRRSQSLSLEEDSYFPNRELLIEVYKHYEQVCLQQGLVDFPEIILKAVELIRDNGPIAKLYQDKFSCILVDEFQDANLLQHSWLRVLTGGDIPVFAVGDDDQLIYGWRGARKENIQQFELDFGKSSIWCLEKNYRSSSRILRAANALIGYNRARMGKALWTDREEGEPIECYPATNEREEAQFVAGRIKEWRARSAGEYSDIAVLYRSNALSRIIEETFIAMSVPYRIYGGLRFFDRAAVKNALAYWRLVHNRNDNASFERAARFPSKGIGSRSLDILHRIANEQSCSLWDTALHLTQSCEGRLSGGGASVEMPARTLRPLKAFLNRIVEMDSACRGQSLSIQSDIIAKPLVDFYAEQGGSAAESNIENLRELSVAADEFEKFSTAGERDEDGRQLRESFFSTVVLDDTEQRSGQNIAESCVQVMTLHAAKGLEFPFVLIIGLEEGGLPHIRSCDDLEKLEEERRLLYVGMTRAQQKLVFSYAEHRNYANYSATSYNRSSRFLNEIPADLLQTDLGSSARSSWGGGMSPRLSVNNGVQCSTAPAGACGHAGICIGSRVAHGKFGCGVVLALMDGGSHSKVQVKFDRAGVRLLHLGTANLKLLR